VEEFANSEIKCDRLDGGDVDRLLHNSYAAYSRMNKSMERANRESVMCVSADDIREGLTAMRAD